MTSATPGRVGYADLLPDHAAVAQVSLPPGADRDELRRIGRRCAGTAIRALSLPERPVGRGPAGEPVWPADLVGSITHGAGICAAAVARRGGTLVGLGIDAAPHRPLSGRVARRVLPGSRWPEPVGSAPVHWESIVFSAKEAVFKAWYPLTGTFLRFSDARLDVAPNGTIQVDLDDAVTAGQVRRRLRGRYRVDREVIRTAVVVEEP